MLPAGLSGLEQQGQDLLIGATVEVAEPEQLFFVCFVYSLPRQQAECPAREILIRNSTSSSYLIFWNMEYEDDGKI